MMDEILELEPLVSESQEHISQMLKLYQDLGKLSWDVESSRGMYGLAATNSGKYYEHLTQDERELSDEELLQFGRLKFHEAYFRRSLSEKESNLSKTHHELFMFVNENLLGRLVQIKTLDEKPHIDVIGMSRKGSYFPERVKKGERTEVRGKIMLPPFQRDSLDMQLRPTRKSRILRSIDDYLVPVVDSFGKILVDVESLD